MYQFIQNIDETLTYLGYSTELLDANAITFESADVGKITLGYTITLVDGELVYTENETSQANELAIVETQKNNVISNICSYMQKYIVKGIAEIDATTEKNEILGLYENYLSLDGYTEQEIEEKLVTIEANMGLFAGFEVVQSELS